MIDPSQFTEQSEWIELAEPLDCCEIGQEVLVFGKINIFRGVIECIKPNCTHIQVKYDADESGYPDTHKVETCDVNEIRCKLCCDNNWFEVDDCVTPDLSGLPNYPPEGEIFLYKGDPSTPDCLWQYQGFGPFKDINSYFLLGGQKHIVDFQLDGYDLTITRSDGVEFTVTLASESIASICFDQIKLDCDEFETL